MVSKKRFGIVGGDNRQIYVARKLKKDGNKVLVCGFEKLDTRDIDSSDMKNVILNSDYVVFPVPVTRNGLHINAPFSDSVFKIDEDMFSLLENKVTFGGIVSPLLEAVKNPNLCIRDYYSREDFMILNAIPTAEGAVQIALKECNHTLWDSKCLVVGYGRIGKILAKLLKDMGSTVTVSARNPRDTALIKANGFEAINVSNIDSEMHFDLIFNTVPTKVLNYENMSLMKSCGLIIDLASLPGGVDKPSAEKLKIRVIPALGLPGKYFPETAGKIIVETIYKIIQEEGL